MKKLLFIFVLVFMLTGCETASTEKESEQKPENMSIFCHLETGPTWRVVYHRDTKVMYVVSNGGYNLGTFTLLVDADGKPLLYEGDD